MISESELRHAIEEQAFVLRFLPVVELSSSRLIGAEALLRLPGNDQELRMPAEFLSVAENTGMIVDLGHWVLNNVCAQISQWRDDGLPPLTVGVNISAHECQHPSFTATCMRALDRYRIDPALLMLEVSDSVLMNCEGIADVLRELREQGTRIALDNYGSGYSSMDDLADLPLDVLKIDRSVTQQLDHGTEARALVDEVLAGADRYGLSVIAEGVETGEQLDYLERGGCRYVQGFLFDKPLAADQLPSLFEG